MKCSVSPTGCACTEQPVKMIPGNIHRQDLLMRILDVCSHVTCGGV